MRNGVLFLVLCLCCVGFLISKSEFFDMLCISVVIVFLLATAVSCFRVPSEGAKAFLCVAMSVLVFKLTLIMREGVIKKTDDYVAMLISQSGSGCLRFDDLFEKDSSWEYMADALGFAKYINYYGFTRRVILWPNGVIRYGFLFDPEREVKVRICK